MASLSTSTNATDPYPLPTDLFAFLTAAKINVSAQLTTAFHDLGFASIEDFDDLDDEMITALANAMKPLEAIRFRRGFLEPALFFVNLPEARGRGSKQLAITKLDLLAHALLF